jgi:hypothetical protein
VNDECRIDYARGLASIEASTCEGTVAVLRDELPQIWFERYLLMCDGPADVNRIAFPGGEYLFDYCSRLVERGELAEDAREDRLVVAFAVSQRQNAARPESRMKGFPKANGRGDKGHFIAHASGGGADINLFFQNVQLNRGGSEQKRYRAMERFVAAHPGTFFFSRPIYADASARPAELEFGVLMSDLRFDVEIFVNA